ncbi:hypothetical protein EDF56_108143 [Novosphingobium sp. PhB165]|uniref:hypothetical protein n=1 Tax=Novosphingobium sp. PhB165 TaxID=2485105 RepID=UPI001043F1A8|nr:hypothetical protein [Novosphingobium sp. PhB165]TCM16154.1 hypothetical protein EDF56_108143 [Novosphingobium sp. PhB165]
MPTMQDKRQDFLWLVQLWIQRERDITGWTATCGDAVAASYRIPASMTARDAAFDFMSFNSEAFRGDIENKCPAWMMGLDDPRYC